ncbi:MAG: hypothetical protein LBD51_09360 [Bifidobacteriaceae bacterium]|jgi:hypothetical protein|nr:hypothetical protein [Bifidobacteriaceae bacterium]
MQSVKDQLGRYCEHVERRLGPTLEQAAALIVDALKQLATFDDPAAREAAALATKALDQVHNVVYGWYGDYTREARELVRRISQ